MIISFQKSWQTFQAPKLIEAMKAHPEMVDWDNDWKFITIFYGGNDLCWYCNHVVSLFFPYSQICMIILFEFWKNRMVNKLFLEILNHQNRFFETSKKISIISKLSRMYSMPIKWRSIYVKFSKLFGKYPKQLFFYRF